MRGALVTGGTSGIGLSFARALAREGRPLVLVARDQTRMDEVAAGLAAEFGVAVECLVADLSDPFQQELVAARLARGDIATLVNNAGFSLKTPIVGGDSALADSAWQVMGRAPRVLAAAAAAAMLAAAPEPGESRGQIITIASASALTRQDTYSALKTYALALTEVLAGELHGTGITVTAVLPGWTRTEFHRRGNQGSSSIPDFLWLDPDRVAADALRDVRRRRVISVPSRRYRVLTGVLNILPGGAVRAVSRALGRHRKRDRTAVGGDS